MQSSLCWMLLLGVWQECRSGPQESTCFSFFGVLQGQHNALPHTPVACVVSHRRHCGHLTEERTQTTHGHGILKERFILWRSCSHAPAFPGLLEPVSGCRTRCPHSCMSLQPDAVSVASLHELASGSLEAEDTIPARMTNVQACICMQLDWKWNQPGETGSSNPFVI